MHPIKDVNSGYLLKKFKKIENSYRIFVMQKNHHKYRQLSVNLQTKM